MLEMFLSTVVNNVFVGEGFAQKSFSIGLQDRFTWLKKSLKASDNASLFDTFDFATTIDPPIIIEDEAPVAIFFRFDSEGSVQCLFLSSDIL